RVVCISLGSGTARHKDRLVCSLETTEPDSGSAEPAPKKPSRPASAAGAREDGQWQDREPELCIEGRGVQCCRCADRLFARAAGFACLSTNSSRHLLPFVDQGDFCRFGGKNVGIIS